MSRRAALALAAFALALPAWGLAAGRHYTPGPHTIPFPAGFERDFIRYATVDKPDRRIVRFLYVNPEAVAAARPGEPLP